MKKLISLLLAGCLLSSGMVFAEPEEETRQVSEQVLETAELLSAVGILELSDFDYFADMTRADAVKKLNRLRNAEVLPNSGIQSFYDLPKTHEDYLEIMTAYNLGYVSGYSDNTFRPEQEITAKEFGVMAVRMLGYGQGAKVDSGFLNLAYDLGIFDGVDTQKSAMNGEDFVEMAANILDTPVYKLEMKDGKYTVSSNKDENALSEFHGIYKEKGVMQKNTLTSIVGTEASSNSITVDGIEYSTDSHEFDGLLGYEVEIFYQEDGADREVVFVHAKGKTDEVTVSAYDINDFSDNTLSYSIGSRQSKRARLDPAFKVVLNGKVSTDYVTDYQDSNSIFREPNGTVRLVDTEGNGRYDVVFVETYLNAMLLKSYTEEDNTVLKLSLQYETTAEFLLTDDTIRVEAYAADGKVYTGKDLINLTAGAVLSIYADRVTFESGKFSLKDASYVRIYESMQTVSGKLDGISEEDGLTLYTINGEEYILSDNNYMSEVVTKLGDTRDFLLNVYGEIVGAAMPDEDPESYQYGYLIKAAIDDSGDTERLSVRMLLADGTVKRMYAAEKLYVNDKRVKNLEVLIGELEDSAKIIVAGKTDMSQIVKYKLDAEGEIKRMETVIDRQHHDDRLSLDNRKKHLMARTKGGVMTSWSWESVEMDDGTQSGWARTMYFIPDKVFLVPDSMRTEDAYYGLLNLKDEQRVYAEAWDVGNDLRPGAMVVYASASNEDIGITPNVIREIKEAIDEDGSIVLKLYAHNGTSDKEYTIEKRDSEEDYQNILSLKKGDIAWLYGDDAHDIVREANVLFRIDDPPKIYERTPVNMSEVTRYQFMELYYVDRERYLTTQRGAIVSGAKREEQFPWCWSGDSSMMRGAVLVDMSGKKTTIRTATPNDLKPAYSYGQKECSKVFTCEGFGSPTFIVVYNGLEL